VGSSGYVKAVRVRARNATRPATERDCVVPGAVYGCAGCDGGGDVIAVNAGQPACPAVVRQPDRDRVRHVLRRAADAGGALGDRYGHRRTILASLAVFAAGAVVAGTASSVVALTAGRCLQGAAAAASVPSALRLLTTITAEGPARRRAIAAWSAAGAAAGASGFVVGGTVTDLLSWRFVFWAFIPLAVLLGAAIAASVPPGADSEPAKSLNLAGSAAFTVAVMAFVIGSTVITQAAGHIAGALR
jgi:Major Facilitator Superfamily